MAPESEVERKMREIREQIGRLESSQKELERTLEDIDHQTRRVSDRIERAGGTDHEAESERARLRDSREVNRRDHESNERRLDQLRAEAAEVQREIDRLRGR